AFWQRLQQALMRGEAGSPGELLQKMQKEGVNAKGRVDAAELALAGDKGTEAGKLLQNQAGRALMEMLKAESNPTNQLEHMLIAMAILQREGLKDSSQKMLSYLKNRYGMSDEEMNRFLAEHGFLPAYQGPMPRERPTEKTSGTIWYLLVSLVVVPISA